MRVSTHTRHSMPSFSLVSVAQAFLLGLASFWLLYILDLRIRRRSLPGNSSPSAGESPHTATATSPDDGPKVNTSTGGQGSPVLRKPPIDPECPLTQGG